MLRVRGEQLSVLSVKVLTKIEGCVHVCVFRVFIKTERSIITNDHIFIIYSRFLLSLQGQ